VAAGIHHEISVGGFAHCEDNAAWRRSAALLDGNVSAAVRDILDSLFVPRNNLMRTKYSLPLVPTIGRIRHPAAFRVHHHDAPGHTGVLLRFAPNQGRTPDPRI
jgi:hypothetical protein